MPDESKGAALNEGAAGGTVSTGEAERRQTAGREGDEVEGGGSPLDAWDKLTGVGQQHRAGRAASQAQKDRAS